MSIDGQVQPFDGDRLFLEPGSHRILLAGEGYEDLDVTVEASCLAETTVQVELKDIAPPIIIVDPLPTQVTAEQGLKVQARAVDNDVVLHMSLYVDEFVIFEAPEPSLRFNINTLELVVGEHELRVVAEDASGNRAQWQSRWEIASQSQDQAPTQSPLPTATVLEPAPTETPVPIPSLTPTHIMPVPNPTPTRVSVLGPVVAYWDQVTIATYDYVPALYVDPQASGHPYPLLHRDRVGPVVERSYDVIVLRNEYLELLIMPELGGRIYQCTFLPTDQPLLYNNPVIKPTHWGPTDQGWWLAVGGIEFCLPVNEHGYLTAQPWNVDIVRHGDSSVTVQVSIDERTRHIATKVDITLVPGVAAFNLATTLRNDSDEPQPLQYWVNAMLSPGKASIGPGLRFYYPTKEMIVHSRGDDSLPDAGQHISWPVYDGRDLSDYDTWRNWLGVFTTQLDAPYNAAYDEETRIGMVRSFPEDIVPGCKLFAFGLGFGDSRAYTDDGSQYAEVWGGLTPTFWDDLILERRAEKHWHEVWYPISRCPGVSVANERAALYAQETDNSLEVWVYAPQENSWRLQVSSGRTTLADQDFTVAPDQPFQAQVPLRLRNVGEPSIVYILDDDGSVVVSYSLSS